MKIQSIYEVVLWPCFIGILSVLMAMMLTF